MRPRYNLNAIPQFITDGHYGVDVSWRFLEKWLAGHEYDVDPPYQRSHVWTRRQASRYVEYCLQGGRYSRELRWNSRGYNTTSQKKWQHLPVDKLASTTLELVDGKQRLKAVRSFLADELEVFNGILCSDFDGFEMALKLHLSFRMTVNSLDFKADVLQWYLDLNSGGTVHTDEELSKVREMLQALKTEGVV